MHQGIVMDIKNDYAIVMDKNSRVLRIKAKDGLNIGDTIFFFEEDIYIKSKTKNNIYKRWIMPLGAVAILTLVLLSPLMNMFKGGESEYAVLTLDVNPSVEIYLDKDGKISEAKGVNDEGVALKLEDMVGLSLEDGMVILKNELNKNDYIKEDTSVLVGFSFLEEEDLEYERRVQEVVKENFNEEDVAYLKGDKKDVEEAKNSNMSLGKYEALLKLNNGDEEEALEGLTTQEILELLKNKDNTIFINKDILEEAQDELEDRYEEELENPPNKGQINEEENNEDDDLDEDNDEDSDDDSDEDKE